MGNDRDCYLKIVDLASNFSSYEFRLRSALPWPKIESLHWVGDSMVQARLAGDNFIYAFTLDED